MKDKENIMSIRVSKNLLKKINTLASAINSDTSEIIRRTARYITNHLHELAEASMKPYEDSENLTEFVKVRNCPEVLVDDKTFRQILDLRCSEALKRCEKTTSFKTSLIAGVDYIITHGA